MSNCVDNNCMVPTTAANEINEEMIGRQNDTLNDFAALHRIVDLFNRTENFELTKTVFGKLSKDKIIPKNLMGYDLLCYAYYKAKDYRTAIKYGELAVGAASSPQEKTSVRYNIGKCYLNGNEPIKAKNSFEMVAKMNPEKVDVKLDLAAALYACNKKEEGFEILKELNNESWKFDERNALAIQFNMGAHYIRHGDLRTGMDYLSIGRKLRIWGSYTHRFPIPEWDGKEYKGKHILIVGEGGIGDEIINARFVKHINAMGMKASFASCQKLDTVLSRMPYETTFNYRKFTTDIPQIMDFDFWTPAMNLPKVCNVDFPDLWDGSYLTVDPEYDKKWKEILPNNGKLRVGIRWSGNPLYEHDLHRSLPLEGLMKKIEDKGWDIYSIQRDYDLERLEQYPNITPLHDKLENFEDALGCLNNLDLIITSCTSIAHAAAALGKKTIVFVPIMDYYIWAEGGKKVSWYGDNLRLARQVTPKFWNEPLNELDQLIEELEIA